jgi:N utilization substance protein B
MENKETITKQYSRTQQHTLIMQCIYQYLFYLPLEDRPAPKDIIECVTKLPINEVDQFIKSTFVTAVKNCQEAVDEISKHLVDWTFDRLCYVDQAILILGYIEIKYLKLPTPVVINLCVKMAQKYCSDDSYKFINGVLDKFKD